MANKVPMVPEEQWELPVSITSLTLIDIELRTIARVIKRVRGGTR